MVDTCCVCNRNLCKMNLEEIDDRMECCRVAERDALHRVMSRSRNKPLSEFKPIPLSVPVKPAVGDRE